MVIALNEVADEPFVSRAVILLVVAIGITVLVYGVVALIVKMDDIGLRLAQTRNGGVADGSGRFLVQGDAQGAAVLSTVGIVAMLWVGGHILLVGVDELGWHAPYDLVHHAEEAVHAVAASAGCSPGWPTPSPRRSSGSLVGAVVVGVMHLLPRRKGAKAAAH